MKFEDLLVGFLFFLMCNGIEWSRSSIECNQARQGNQFCERKGVPDEA